MIHQQLLNSYAKLAHRVRRRPGLEWRKRTYVPREEQLVVESMMRGDFSGVHPRIVHARALGGAAVTLRPGTSDAGVLYATFVGTYHLPPREIHPQSIRVIWDLGSNIGLTIAHYAVLYPLAQVHGVELDGATAAVATQNIAPWRERCSLQTGAVWHADGTISYALDKGDEEGAHVVEGSAEATITAAAFSLNTLFAPYPVVDFVKFDIEGAEQQVLTRATEWASRVRALKVEVHTPYPLAQCQRDLAALGFRTRLDTAHWSSIIGVR